MKLPLLTPKPQNTKPYIDWYRVCGIDNVYTEDDTMRHWEKWMLKCQRFGRRTTNAELSRHFTSVSVFKQTDVYNDEQRSSDINLQLMYLENRTLIKTALPVTISEHAVRRFWERTSSKPRLLEWVMAFPVWQTDFSAGLNEMYCADGLLLGELFKTDNVAETWNIDTKTFQRKPGFGFRIKTVIPVGMLNEGQQYRWHKLKTKREEQK